MSQKFALTSLTRRHYLTTTILSIHFDSETALMKKTVLGDRILQAVRLPPDVKAWIETQSAFQSASQTAVIVRALRVAMEVERREARAKAVR
jgi:hypothetical protein